MSAKDPAEEAFPDRRFTIGREDGGLGRILFEWRLPGSGWIVLLNPPLSGPWRWGSSTRTDAPDPMGSTRTGLTLCGPP
jgi:hypothetical protein